MFYISFNICIGYKEDLLTRLVPSDAGDKQDMIVQYFIKVGYVIIYDMCVVVSTWADIIKRNKKRVNASGMEMRDRN